MKTDADSVSISVGRAKSIAAQEHALAAGSLVGIVLQKDPQDADPGLAGLCPIGTLAKVVHYLNPQELDTVDDAIRSTLAEPGTRRVPPDFELV